MINAINADYNARKYAVEYAQQTVSLYIYCLVGFLVPFVLGHPQFLVGPIVNMMLVMGALEARSLKFLLPLIVSPTLGVLARGVLFGPLTPFVLMMMPFIWAGNAILVFGIMKARRRGINYWIGLSAASLAKSAFLFSIAFALVSAALLPSLFLSAMGIFQLWTAIAGGAAAFALHRSGLVKKALAGFESPF